jgi:polysaccharide biosynthesis protein PslH
VNEIAFLCDRLPETGGERDAERAFRIAERLARMGPVHAAIMTDGRTAPLPDRVASFATVCATHMVRHREKSASRAFLEAFVRGESVAIACRHDLTLAAYVQDLFGNKTIGAAYVCSAEMLQYVPAEFAGRLIVDLAQVGSMRFAALAAYHRGIPRWFYAREASVQRREEAQLAKRASVVLLGSDIAAAGFRASLPAETGRNSAIRSLRSGFDDSRWQQGTVSPEPRLAAFPRPRILVTGPVELRESFAALEALLPALRRIRSAYPKATFHLVGECPSARLAALHGLGGVHVWNARRDAHWYAAADIALAPGIASRAGQPEIFEAMAMSLPVVIAPRAPLAIAHEWEASGIQLTHDEDELVETVMQLVSDRAFASRARAQGPPWLLEHAGWDKMLSQLPEIVGSFILPKTEAELQRPAL